MSDYEVMQLALEDALADKLDPYRDVVVSCLRERLEELKPAPASSTIRYSPRMKETFLPSFRDPEVRLAWAEASKAGVESGAAIQRLRDEKNRCIMCGMAVYGHKQFCTPNCQYEYSLRRG